MKKHSGHLILPLLLFSLTASTPLAAAENIFNPSEVCGYLADMGLNTREWKMYQDEKYACTSRYKEIGAGYPLVNNLIYYATGTKAAAREMTLVLSVNSRGESKSAHSALLKATEELAEKLYNGGIPATVREGIVKGKNVTANVSGFTIRVIRDNWPTHKGYSVKVAIK